MRSGGDNSVWMVNRTGHYGFSGIDGLQGFAGFDAQEITEDGSVYYGRFDAGYFLFWNNEAYTTQLGNLYVGLQSQDEGKQLEARAGLFRDFFSGKRIAGAATQYGNPQANFRLFFRL